MYQVLSAELIYILNKVQLAVIRSQSWTSQLYTLNLMMKILCENTTCC